MIKNFKLQIALRLCLFCVTITFAIYSLFQAKLYFSFSVAVIILVGQVYTLYKYLDKTNRMIASFFDNIKYSEYTTQSGESKQSKSLQNLQHSMNSVIEKISTIAQEKESQYHFIQHIIQRVEVGIIVFDSQGRIELTNKAFGKILKSPVHKNISELREQDLELCLLLQNIDSNRRQLYKYIHNNTQYNYSVLASQFTINDTVVNLVSFQNIQPELDQNEIVSWQKLTSVLTHEIMNSITPISSLAGTIANVLPEGEDQIANDDLDDIKQALATIGSRSKGLIDFVNRYRTITKVPLPEMEEVTAEKLIDEVKPLIYSEIGEKKIVLKSWMSSPNIVLLIDKNQIQQVLINLTKNAIHSMESGGVLDIIVDEEPDRLPKIMVKDSGKGIAPDVLDKIFIPFYTTKPTGSGIGLSLAKQIMQMHGGILSVQSTVGEGTLFTMQF